MNWRRFILGISFLLIVIGTLLICFIQGGLLNTSPYYGIHLDQPLHIVGFVLLIVGAIGLILVWSLNKPSRPI